MSLESQSLQPCGMEVKQIFLYSLYWVTFSSRELSSQPLKALGHQILWWPPEHRWQKGEARPSAGWRTDQRCKGHPRNTSDSPDRAASSSSIHDKRRYWECHKPHSLVVGTSMIPRNQTRSTPVRICKASETTDTHDVLLLTHITVRTCTFPDLQTPSSRW